MKIWRAIGVGSRTEYRSAGGGTASGLSNKVYRLSRKHCRHTPTESIGQKLFWEVTRRVHGQRSAIGFYRVRNLPDPIRPFTIAIDRTHNELVDGESERSVLEKFAELLSPTSVWEIGAGWGYYSLAASTVAEHVAAAADLHLTDLFLASRDQ